MMPSYRFTGPTVAFGMTSSGAHTPVMVSTASGQNDIQSYAAFLNPSSTGIVAVILTTGQASSGAVNAFPADGTPSASTFLLPPLMQYPMVVATPGSAGGFWCSGISNLVGTTTIFVTPCSSQS